jgi:hypothetical protein
MLAFALETGVRISLASFRVAEQTQPLGQYRVTLLRSPVHPPLHTMRGLSPISRRPTAFGVSLCLRPVLLRTSSTLAFTNRHANVLPVHCGRTRFQSNESTNIPAMVHDPEEGEQRNRTVFVGKLPRFANHSDLKHLFASAGLAV